MNSPQTVVVDEPSKTVEFTIKIGFATDVAVLASPQQGYSQTVCQHPKLVGSFVSTILVLYRTPDIIVRYLFRLFV